MARLKPHSRLPRTRLYRPVLERLEDRLAPAVLSIPINLIGEPGGAVAVPVNIDNPNPAGSGGLTHASLAIDYNTALFSVANADVALGALTSGWTLTPLVDNSTGQIGITLDSGGNPLTSTVGGSIVLITFHVNLAAPLGTAPINLGQSNAPGGTPFTTALLAGANGPLALNPAPTNSAYDPGIDGSVNVARINWAPSPSSAGGYTPTQMQTAYGTSQVSFTLAGTTFSEANQNLGQGTTIAVVDPFDDPDINNDLAQFDAAFNLPAASLTVVSPTGTLPANAPVDTNAGIEIAADVEWAHAIAPGAKILLVEAQDYTVANLTAAAAYAGSQPGVVALSLSWGFPGEFASETAYDSTFVSPNGQPVTFLAASGDNGPPPAWPATSPNVVAVGGTTLALDSSGNILSETGWGGSGGGLSSFEPQPAYQSGVVTQHTSMRANPDVAYDADSDTGFSICDSYDASSSSTPWVAFGGTSIAVPQWTALIAIADQWRLGLGLTSLDGPSQTLPRLYAVAGTADFHDVTSGSNGTYSAGPGYDLVTGLGSPAGNNLINDLANSHLAITAASRQTAGSAFGVTVHAEDASGNIVVGYRGTVQFMVSDSGGGVQFPLAYTFTAADAGVHVFTGGITLVSAGTQTVTVSDNWGDISGTATFTVNAAGATHFAVAGSPTTVTAGGNVVFSVTALDQFNNPASAYGGTVLFTTTDSQAAPPSNTTLMGGTGYFSITLKTAGTQTLTVADTVTASIAGTSNGITVSPAGIARFAVSGPTPVTAATSFNFTVQALDAFGNTATGYTGTVQFTTSDGTGSVPANSSLSGGVGTFAAVLRAVGNQVLTATDTATASITGTASTNVIPGSATHFSVAGLPNSATAGSAVAVTVMARDAANNTATGYTGTVHFTTSDPSLSSTTPATYTFTPADLGVHVFTSGVELVTASSQTLTATDSTTATITGSSSITVVPAVASQFNVVAPANASFGTAFSVTVTAQDPFGNTATGYNGSVQFGSSDGQAVLPPNSTLTGGTGTFSVTLRTSGSQTVSVTDTVTSSITGTTGPINVLTPGILLVTTDSDSAGHSGTSLRDAVAKGNADAAAGKSDTIAFDPSLNGTTITLTQGQFELTAGTGTTTIDGDSQITIDANMGSRVFQVDNGAQAVFAGLTMENGKSDNSDDNNSGGGIDNDGGTLTLTNCTVDNNSANEAGTFGGGIYNHNSGTLVLTNCTLANDSTGGWGGGIGISTGTVTLTNCTFANNSCTASGSYGGGIFSQGATLTLTYCTVAYNSAGNGGGIYDKTALPTLNNTIVASNTASVGPEIINGNGITPAYVGINDLVGNNALLGPLQNNGGPTQTMALLPDSPAIGAGALIGGITTDQRGFPRPPSKTDIGAFQVQYPVDPFVESINRTNPSGPTTNAGSVSFTVTFSQAVTGVDPTDFRVALGGTVGATLTQVTPVSASVYSVTVSGITGSGTLGLNLVDNGSIHNLDGLPLAQQNGPVAFQAQQTFATGSNPRSVALGNVAGFGAINDLVVANVGSNMVSVLLPNANGTFQAQQTFAAGPEPISVALGDLTGDGQQDLVVADSGSDTVSVLLGYSNGDFPVKETLAAGYGPFSVALGDLTGNGKLDVVVGDDNNTVSVLLGNGNGTFQAHQTFSTGAGIPPGGMAVALGDVNGDGIPDIIAANVVGNSVSVLLGNGNGTFQAPQTFAVGDNPLSLALGDLTGDGKLDVVVANNMSNTVSVLLGNGNGTFLPQQTFATGAEPFSVALGDVNGDGKPDLVVANINSNTVSVLLGNGNGTFEAQQTFATGHGPASVAMGDVNGDGKPDLIVANDANNTVSVLLGNSNGNFTGQAFTIDTISPYVESINCTTPPGPTVTGTSVSYTVTFSEPVTGVAATDFQLSLTGTVAGTISQAVPVSTSVYTVTVSGITGNGTLGLNLVDNGSIHDLTGNALTYQNSPAFFSQMLETYAISGSPVSTAWAVALGDVNGDGIPDMVVANAGFGAVSVFLGNGHGTFQPQQTFAAGSFPIALAMGDVNGDGNLDIVVADRDSNTVGVLLGNGNGTFGALMGNGNGTMQGPQPYSTGSQPVSVALADVNGDGKLDIVVANQFSNSVSVLLGNGNGTFQPQGTYATGSEPVSVAVADLTGDGIPDIVVANERSNSVSVLMGDGSGKFQPQQTFATGAIPFSVALTDLNGDGKPDIVVANAVSNTVSVLLGNGNGTFQPQQTFGTGPEPVSVAVGDLTGNGIPDIVVANEFSQIGSVLQGNGNGTFQPQQTFASGNNPVSLVLGDLTGNGKPDIVLADDDYPIASAGVLLNASSGNFVGQDYTIDHAATHFLLTGPSTATAGNVSITVTAQDISNLTAPGYTGTVHFTSSDAQAGLPADYTFQPSDNGVHVFTVSLQSVGNQTVTATDTVTSTVAGTSTTILVNAAGAHFLITNPTSALAGTPIHVTITALDGSDIPVPGYAGSVTLTSSDHLATLPAPGTLTGGVGILTATLMTPGNQTLTAADTVVPSIAGTTGAIFVYPLGTHFAVTASLPSITAGGAVSFTVTAQNGSNQTLTGYNGTIHFTSSDTQAGLPADGTLTNGVGIFNVIFKTAGRQTLTVTDTVVAAIMGMSGAITVNPAGATHFSCVGPGVVAPGVAFPLTVTALDVYDNTVTSYAGAVHFSSSDPTAVLPVNNTLPNGVRVFPGVVLNAGGIQLISATDVTTPGISGTGFVYIGLPKLMVSIPSTLIAGATVQVTVKAVDTLGNTLTNFNDPLNFTCTDKTVVAPPLEMVAGVCMFSIYFLAAGPQTITVTDFYVESLSATSSSVTVSPTVVSKFAVTPTSGTTEAGRAITVKVLAQDQYGNQVSSYSGTVHFTSSDSQANLPADATLTAGLGIFTTATLKTAGVQTLTATDTLTTTIKGTSAPITIRPGAAAQIVISDPSITAGSVLLMTVTAQDQFGNAASYYSGTLHFTSSDSQAVLPPDAALASPVGIFAATLETAGLQTFTATDTINSSITGSTAVTVQAASAANFVISAPNTVIAGTPFHATIMAQDLYGNAATSYSGAVQFQSTGLANFPTNLAVTAGVATCSATFLTPGSQVFTATDAATGNITGSATVTVTPAPTTHFLVTTLVSSTTAGSPIVLEVTALDSLNQSATAYTGTIQFTSSDGQAVLPANSTLANGFGIFAAELRTAGNQTLTVTDTSTNSLTGTSAPITVSASNATHLSLSAPPAVVSASVFSITVEALDAFNNFAANYGGTVGFSSSDGGATLPIPGTLTGGLGTFSATLAAPGDQTISATDTTTSGITGTSNTILDHSLAVNSFTPTATGFVATFNQPFNPNTLNLYDAATVNYGPADVRLQSSSGPPVLGSLLLDPSDTTITFVKTSDFDGIDFDPSTGVLAAGTYTATFRSATNGFVDNLGNLLDGAGSGNSGTSFVTTFVVGSSPVVVGVPAFARGPGNSVNLPNTTAGQAAGIPLNLSNGAGVTSGVFELQYNSTLLNITTVTVNASLTGASLTLDPTSTPGNTVVDFSSPTALPAGVISLGSLQASVPIATASVYKDKSLLHFASEQLNGGSLAVTGDDAVQIVAYLGDLTGIGTLTGLDASLVSRVGIQLDSGFAAYPLLDPVIVAGLTSDGGIVGADVTLLNSLLAGVAHAQIPPIPTGVTITPAGPDPALSMPTDLQVTTGGTVIVPVNIDTAKPEGSTGLMEAVLALRYDPRVFTVSAADVQVGSLTSSGWQLTAAVNNQIGEIGIDLFSMTPIQTTAAGTLVTIALHVRDTAPATTTGIYLVTQVNPTGQRVFRTEAADAQGALVLHMATTPAGEEPGAPALVTVSGGQLRADGTAMVDGEQRMLDGNTSHSSSPSTDAVLDQVFGDLNQLLVRDSLYAQPEAIMNSSTNDQVPTAVRDLALGLQSTMASDQWDAVLAQADDLASAGDLQSEPGATGSGLDGLR